MTTALGKISFLDLPDVNGDNVIVQSALTGAINTAFTNPIFTGSGSITLPSGTTAGRPTGVNGMMRYNTTSGEPEAFANGTWLPLGRVVQSVSGTIGSVSGSVISKTSTVNLPTTTDRGVQAFTTTFTPTVVGSSLVIQYVLTASQGSTTSRVMYTSVWVGTTPQGVSISGGLVGQNTTLGVGAVNLALQCVYTTTALTPLTISGYVGHILATTTAQTINVNLVGTSGNFGGALSSEYRILEII